MADIRPAIHSDLEGLNGVYNAYVLESPATFDIEPVSMERRLEWFEHYRPDGRYRVFVACEGPKVVGFATSSRFMERKAYETSVTTSVYCRMGCEGRGIGSALYRALFDALAFEDVHRAYGGITMPNPASVALHEKFGFKQVAYFTEQGRKFGRYWDVVWMEKELG